MFDNPRVCVVDTMILQKSNAALTRQPRDGRFFVRRVRLLTDINAGSVKVLISGKLLSEYRRQIQSPRNEYVKTFFELLDRPDRVIWNWTKRWPGGRRAAARDCHYPGEDIHLLRTAIREVDSEIVTEEDRLLRVDACIHRRFRVHISPLP